MGGPFGVRRPLRFLAHKLELDRLQVTQVAEILDDVKTERAQAAVDDRRAQKQFAEAVSSDSFDAAKASEAAKARSASSVRVDTAVVAALERLHTVLTAEQRAELGLLLRTGTLTV